MATVRAMSEWKPYRLFPWAEWRRVGLYSDMLPNVLIDIGAIWTERRWRKMHYAED